MLFPTVTFAAFFTIVYPLSWMLNARPRAWKWALLAASYVFYGWWDARFVALLVISTVANAFVAQRIGRPEAGRVSERAWLGAGITFNLGLLGVFKYYGFFAESLAQAAQPLGLAPPLPLLHVVLPVGISFFTFQAISYLVDVWRSELAPRGVLDVAVYLAFFPQLVAGPIVRATEFFPELNKRRALTDSDAHRAAVLIAGGLFKKVVVSSTLATGIVDPVFAVPTRYSAPEVLLAIYAYAIQIYADFSGYTDIAIGIALLLGFHFPDNFDRPYAADSIRDFWRRWHITLSRWLRDYLYIPLGGNRGGRIRTYRNLLLTMALGGLWHGAAMTFVAWGVFHGLGLGLERALGVATPRLARLASPIWNRSIATSILPGAQQRSSRLVSSARKPASAARTWAARCVTFHFVCVGWVLFRSESWALAADVFRGVTSPAAWRAAIDVPDPSLATPEVLLATAGVLLAQTAPWDLRRRLELAFARLPRPAQAAALGACTFLIVTLGPQGVAPFIYFRF